MISKITRLNKLSGIMEKDSRLIVVLILMLALWLRLTFVIQLPEQPIYWDEFYYDACARRYERAWQSLFNDSSTKALFREAFERGLQKGETYSQAVGFFYAVFGPKPKVVFIFQALLDTVSCFFIYLLASRMGGRGVGLIALASASFYEPFIFSTARLQTETFASFLYLGGLCGVFLTKPRWQLAGNFTGGLLIALAMLTKPLFKYLFPVLLLTVSFLPYVQPRHRRFMLALSFSAGFLVLIVPRLILTNSLTGQPLWNGSLDPSIEMYAGAVIENVGWKTGRLSFAYPPSDELLAVLGNDPSRPPSFTDYRRATFLTWFHYPIESASVMIHKLYQAWAHPYNDSHNKFLSGLTGQSYYHQTVLVLCIIGMPLALRAWGIAIPLILTTLYIWATYLSIKIEVRNAFPAMPLMLCFSALAAWKLVSGVKSAFQSGYTTLIVLLLSAVIVGVMFVELMSIARITEAFPILTVTKAHAIRVGATVLLIMLISYLLYQILSHGSPRKTEVTAAIVPLALAVSMFVVGRPIAENWRQWHSPLHAGGGMVRQEFFLPPNLKPPNSAELRLDMLPSHRGGYDLVIRVNGEEIRRYRGGVKRRDADIPDQSSYTNLYEIRGEQREPVHAWYTVPLSLEKIVPGERIQVEVEVEAGGGESGFVTVFGDYSQRDDAYDGPSLLSPGLLADTSLYKYLVEGDFRMRRQALLSGSGLSSFYNGHNWSVADLSIKPGRQYGRYRIFLLLKYDDKKVVI